MPIIKSAIKRVRVSDRKRKHNLITLRRYKELVKEFEALVATGKKAEAQKLFPSLQKAIDMADKKNIIPKNRARRQKSRLSKLIKSTETKDAKAAPKKEEKKAA